jgi:glycosyltransferase involved in cell wall biosynthesis
MMGVGVPQILPKSGRYEEFANINNSQLLPIKQSYYVTNNISEVPGEARAVDANDVFLALEKYLLMPSLIEEHGRAAREAVVGLTWEKAAAEFFSYLKGL